VEESEAAASAGGVENGKVVPTLLVSDTGVSSSTVDQEEQD
jgi:hypothetical protein